MPTLAFKTNTAVSTLRNKQCYNSKNLVTFQTLWFSFFFPVVGGMLAPTQGEEAFCFISTLEFLYILIMR